MLIRIGRWTIFGKSSSGLGPVSTVVGALFGVLAAVNVYSAWDYLLGAVSLLGFSVPSFFLALIALYVFAARWQVLPAYGMSTGANASSLGDNLYHLILPATVLSVELMATLTQKFPGVDFNFSQYIQDNVEEVASGVKGENSVKIYGNDLETLLEGMKPLHSSGAAKAAGAANNSVRLRG